MDDTISRQAAIDIERRATVDTNPKHFESHQKFMEFMDDAEISSFGRWQWSNGFNTALTAVGIDLKGLPSADRTGAWIKATGMMPPEFHGHHCCSECGRFANMESPFGNREDLSKFCPRCGARMVREDGE